MKIAVLIKYCPDSEAVIEVEGGKLQTALVKHSISPYDEYACEEALRITEADGSGEVVLFSVSTEAGNKGIKDELARGAHRAVHVVTDSPEIDSHRNATLLAAALKAENPDLILCGWKGIDYDNCLTGTLVAEKLGIPHVAVVTKIETRGGKAVCHRQVEGGEEVIEVALPAVIAAQKGLNEPRYPSLKGIMAAKKKPVDKKAAGAMGVELPAPSLEYTRFDKPPAKQPGKKFDGPESVAEVVRLLRDEAKVL
jgi:electron transfer flavoprotein beta subunit